MKKHQQTGAVTVEVMDGIGMVLNYNHNNPGYIRNAIQDRDGLFLQTSDGYYQVKVVPADGRKIANKFRGKNG